MYNQLVITSLQVGVVRLPYGGLLGDSTKKDLWLRHFGSFLFLGLQGQVLDALKKKRPITS